MKRLIWKELNEQRYIPLAYAALLCMILLVWNVMGDYMATHGGSASDRMSLNNAIVILGGGLLLAGLLPGSNTIASEASQGTLSFLLTMPVSRGKLWLCKVTAGILIMLASAVAMILVFFLFSQLAFRFQVYAAISKIIPLHLTLQMTAVLILYAVLIFLLLAMYSYSVSLFCSSITDRPLAASGLAICVGLGLLFARTSLIPTFDLLVEPSLAALGIGFLVASWAGFRASSGTGIVKRRIVTIVVLFACMAAYSVTIGSAYWYFHRIALMSLPTVTLQTQRLGPGLNQSDHKLGYVSYGISYGRVKVGRTYQGTILVRINDQLRAAHLFRARCSSGNISGKIQGIRSFEEDRGRWRGTINYYQADYIYAPALPVGSDTQSIDFVDENGVAYASLRIAAQKSEGFTPPDDWFPDIQRQRYNVLAQ